MKVAIYPGTFDPITFGHVDLITKGLRVVDKIIVAISSAINKNHLFSVDERMLLMKNALHKDLKINKKIYIHINTTNPILLPYSDERKIVEENGWQVSYDGMEITL